ncbi:MAG: pyridine nucleotide-disulfide oxidoreductase [Marmoricola sp.]|nr:pyridine nucleotide-disulfide oxidoreductase [Marmoricola sp.]
MNTGCLDDRLTTSPAAAYAYRAGVEALSRADAKALQHFARALALDPTFALAHAALALMGHDHSAPVDVKVRLAAAVQHARRSTEAEQLEIAAIAGHINRDVREVVLSR